MHNLRLKYIDSKKLYETQFKRYIDLSSLTFDYMVEQLKMPVANVQDQVLLCLSYWREYRILFHVARSYGGKKTVHTFKVQTFVHYRTQKILSLRTSRGTVHNFELFKRNLNQIPVSAFILADKSYQEII